MKIAVDRERCQGHSRCFAHAPDLFTVDELGYASAARQGTVTVDRENDARLAAANCPERAIRLDEDN
jgi:ferredoxin